MTHIPIAEDTSDKSSSGQRGTSRVALLTLGAIGVVYGDIGTSPLYALRESVTAAAHGGPVTETIVLGVLSLIFWSLTIVVTLKYIIILLNADNKGEGGTLSLMALAQRGRGKFIAAIPILGMLGASLFYGDAMITPAISVLSAIEGLKVVTPAFDPYVLWITLAIIVGLFAVQSSGTGQVARLFGPVTLVWFLAIAAAGVANIALNPQVLLALNPLHAVSFLSAHGTIGLVTLGAVFLAVTGAEALYADLGHFGKTPIRIAWLAVALPALVLNYMGQGAAVLARPEILANPFFLILPEWALVPMVVLATAATIIASQAVITGAFSLTRQAVQLGLLPRMQVTFTSATEAGQIYMPQVNWMVMAGVIALVLVFKSSSALATAYGIAVTGTMVVTSILAMFVIKNRWRWSMGATLATMLPLLAIDAIFLGANSLKIMEGGWMPLALGACLMAVMWSWRAGTRQLAEQSRRLDVPLKETLAMLDRSSAARVPDTAVFFTADPDWTPPALLHSLKHYKVLHARNVILTLRTADTPYVRLAERARHEGLSTSFTRIILSFGYLETPDVPEALGNIDVAGQSFRPMETTYFLSRRRLVGQGGIGHWMERIFMFLSKHANDASGYFQLPEDRVVEVGTRIAI